MKKVLFLGLGHLGQFFVRQNNGKFNIIGTKRQQITDLGCPIIPYSLGSPWSAPKDFDSIVISFPPQENYSQKLQLLLDDLKPIHQIIFISSTSVFGPGEINEDSPKEGQTKNAKELIQCEEMISAIQGSLIIRPGGLIDEKRTPKNFLKKVSKISKSLTPVNLVHTYDVAAFIHFAIEERLIDNSYNLVCDDHPTKEEFYGGFGLDLHFDPTGSQHRVISNAKSKNTRFKYTYSKLYSYNNSKGI